MQRTWTDVTAGLHFGAQEEVEPDEIHNKVMLWLARDHFPVYGTILQDDGQGHFFFSKKKKKEWAGWRRYVDKARIN